MNDRKYQNHHFFPSQEDLITSAELLLALWKEFLLSYIIVIYCNSFIVFVNIDIEFIKTQFFSFYKDFVRYN